MSLNKSEAALPNPPSTAAVDSVPTAVVPTPDYGGLVRVLIEPFLETTDTLRVDCEVSGNGQRVWVRIAFDETDRGRVFGRGGRNIQAVRTVLKATAALANQVAHLDVYGSGSEQNESHPAPTSNRPRPSRPRRRET